MEQDADGFAIVDPAHGFGQGGGDGQYRPLWHPLLGGNGNRVCADDFEHVGLCRKTQGSGTGENPVCASDPNGTSLVVAQMPKQFQDGAAADDLIVENDDVAVTDVADQH